MKDITMFYLKRLEELLAASGKRRPWLHEETDIPLSTINGWFSRGALPSVPDLIEVLRALSITLEEFFSPIFDPENLNVKSKKRRVVDAYLDKLSGDQLTELMGFIKMFILYKNIPSQEITFTDFFS